jgi:membrane-bound lytic murein transglycosylase D
MWQFMRGTALENGLKHDWYVDERAEPEKATRAAARYLKTLSDMFDGDWHLALASYNGGPGRVQRAVKRAGSEDFWKVASSSRYLPRETRDYVPLILAAIIIARNPVQYGMEIAPPASPPAEAVTLPTAVDLRRVADWVGTPVETLRQLNPELRRWTTPVRDAAYDLKVPMGTGDIVRAHLALGAPEDLAAVNWYSVRGGDTLLSVAKRLGVPRTDLAQANYLSTKARLQTGQRLVVPRAPQIILANRDVAEPAAVSDGREVVRVSNSNPAPVQTRASSVVYRVKRGDTLFSIARLYRTTVAALQRWNNLRSSAIQVGQRLTIFPEHSTTSTD